MARISSPLLFWKTGGEMRAQPEIDLAQIVLVVAVDREARSS